MKEWQKKDDKRVKKLPRKAKDDKKVKKMPFDTTKKIVHTPAKGSQSADGKGYKAGE